MTNVVVVGTQWGDEGKGKIVDWLSARADIVVRFQGGHNAGHTLVVDGSTYKLSLLPSGIVRGKLSVIGNGVVVDPEALVAEIAVLRDQGLTITPENLRIAENCALILPLHRRLDALREQRAGKGRIGTTQRGIGPAYEDKVGRRAIRLCDLADREGLAARLERLAVHHNGLRAAFGEALVTVEGLACGLDGLAEQLVPFAAPVWRLLADAQSAGQRIMFEGAQGAMLDIDHGTYPFVTSSNTLAGSAACGSGVGPGALHYVLGITKAYTTRVGAGPFPSEQDNETGRMLGERGHEFGTVTGRRRRCGWLDIAMLRHSVRLNGLTGIALTKLDVLDGLDELKICVGYRLNGSDIDAIPSGSALQAQLQPVYESLPGWSQPTRGVRRREDLPARAINYIRYIEEQAGAPVALLSTSPARNDTILVQDPFAG